MRQNTNIKNKIIKNSFLAISSSIINKIGSIIFVILLARFLLPEGYGIYSIIFSITMVFAIFADLGVDQTFVRYLSFALVKEKNKINSYYKYLLKIKFILAITSSLFLFILAYPLSFIVFKNSALFLPLLVCSLYVLILPFEGFYTSIFYSIDNIKYITYLVCLKETLKVISVLIIFYLFPSRYSILWIFTSLTIISLITILISKKYTKKLIPKLYVSTHEKINRKRVRRFVGFLTIATISGVFFSYIDSIILGLFVSPEYVGYYRAAFSFIISISSLFGVFSVVLLPIFSKVNKIKKEVIFNKAFKYMTILSIPCTFGLLALGKYFITLFYGSDFLPAINSLYLLSFLIFPFLYVNVLLSLFSANEKPEIFAKFVFISSILNVVLNFILINYLSHISPIFATIGASIATLISWLFYLFALVYFLKKEFKFNISFKPLVKPLFSSLTMYFVLFYLLKLDFFKDMNLLLGIILVFIGISVYFTFLFLIKGIKKEELIKDFPFLNVLSKINP